MYDMIWDVIRYDRYDKMWSAMINYDNIWLDVIKYDKTRFVKEIFMKKMIIAVNNVN